MRYKNLPFAFSLLLVTGTLNAQLALINGRVWSAGKPVPFASVVSKTENGGVQCDSLGAFILALKPGLHWVEASASGFQTLRKHFTVTDSGIQKMEISLEPAETQLEEVVVTGTLREYSQLKSPVPVEVYSRSFFRCNPAPSVFESLQNINGVRPQLNCNVCNTGDIRINGLEGPYTMVLIDGMPIVSGLSTVYGLNGIPQALIDRVELVKGPASTLYGSEAIGGLLNIITRKTETAPQFAADVFTTSWEEWQADMGLKFRAGTKAAALLGVNYFHYQRPFDNNADGFTDVTLQQRVSVFNKWNFTRAKGRRFTLAGRYLYEDRWGGQMDWQPKFRGGDSIYGESIYTSRWELIGGYDLPTHEKLTLQWSANGHYQNSYYGNTFYKANQEVVFAQLLWLKNRKRHHLTAGAAYRLTRYDDNTPATGTVDTTRSGTRNAPAFQHLPGIFFQDEIRLSQQQTLLLGLRYDHNNLNGSVITPRVNYKWASASDNTIFRIGAGSGFRVANVFTEDHAALTGARTLVFEEDLKPEKSWNVTLNFTRRFQMGKAGLLVLDGSAFYTHFTNRIVPDYETDANKIIYANLDGYAVSKGVSVNASLINAGGWRAMGGFTLMDVSLTEAGMKQRQLLTERFSAVWNIGYTIKSLRMSLDYTGNLYGPMLLPLLGPLDNRPAESPIWSLQNMQVAKALGNRLECYAGIKNLLNYTPPANSIARPFDPFDRQVVFDDQGQVVPTPENPNALSFDPTYMFAPNQGRRGYLGLRYTFK
jgi:outer membrane receptor for ferrienterochelin and colicins